MDISSVNDWEYVNLIGQYNQLDLGKGNEIDPRLLSRLSEEQINVLRKEMGENTSTEVISLNLHFTKMGLWDYSKFGYVMVLFTRYDNSGTMPYPGSHSEQPGKIIDIFNILSQLKGEAQQRDMNKQKRETDRKSKVNGNTKR